MNDMDRLRAQEMIDRINQTFALKKINCPCCGQLTSHDEIAKQMSGMTIYGKTLQEIAIALDFQRQHEGVKT